MNDAFGSHPFLGALILCLLPLSCAAVFQNLLHQTWFELYSRGRGSDDSSGFEHVFVGESKRGEVTVRLPTDAVVL